MTVRFHRLRRTAAALALLVLLGGCGARALNLPSGVLVYQSAIADVFSFDHRTPAAPVTSNPTSGGLSVVATASPSSRFVVAGQTVALTAGLVSADNRLVDLQWSASAGTLSKTGPNAMIWVAPVAPGDATIQIIASSGLDIAPAAFRFTVQ